MTFSKQRGLAWKYGIICARPPRILAYMNCAKVCMFQNGAAAPPFISRSAHEKPGIVHQRDRRMAQATRELTAGPEEVVLGDREVVDDANAPARHDAVLVRHARAGREAVERDERHT